MRCFVRNTLLLSWQLPNFSVVLAYLSSFGPKNTLKFAETFDFSTYVPGLEKKRVCFFFNKAPSLHALVIYFRECNYNLLSWQKSKATKAPSNRKSSSQDCFYRLSLSMMGPVEKEYSLLVLSRVFSSGSVFVSLFQSTNLNVYKVCSVDALAAILLIPCAKRIWVTSTCKKEENGTSCLGSKFDRSTYGEKHLCQ